MYMQIAAPPQIVCAGGEAKVLKPMMQNEKQPGLMSQPDIQLPQPSRGLSC
jgi:hypothetical protein